MSNKLLFTIGILGVTLFAVASILGGFQSESYNHVTQYISESMAIDTPYGKLLRYVGYLPAGVLLTVFSFLGYKKLPKSSLVKIGFWGVGIFYGFSTIIVGLFPCDAGCNKALIDPSISQIIHNFSGILTYLFMPTCMILIGVGLLKFKKYRTLSLLGILSGLLSFIFIGLLSDPSTNYAGLFQRVIEVTFIIWIIACAIYIKRGIETEDKIN